MNCKNCGTSESKFRAVGFGKKQCTCCGTTYTKVQLDAAKRAEAYHAWNGKK